jgi:hypothetical protein
VRKTFFRDSKNRRVGQILAVAFVIFAATTWVVLTVPVARDGLPNDYEPDECPEAAAEYNSHKIGSDMVLDTIEEAAEWVRDACPPANAANILD